MNLLNNDILIYIQSYINIYEQLLISKKWLNNIKYILQYRCNKNNFKINDKINDKIKIEDIINILIENSNINNTILTILLKYDSEHLKSMNNINNIIDVNILKTYFKNITNINYNDFQLSSIFKYIKNNNDITEIPLFNSIIINGIITNNISGIHKNAHKYNIICVKELCNICNIYPRFNKLEIIKKHFNNKKYIVKGDLTSSITIYNLYQSKEYIKSCMNFNSYKYEKYEYSNYNLYLQKILKNKYILDIKFKFVHI
jgi:hypothetical protein